MTTVKLDWLGQEVSKAISQKLASGLNKFDEQLAARARTNLYPGLQYDPGGTPDIDTAIQNVRIRAACYGEDDFQAARVHTALIHVTREANRVVITTSNGVAFVYWLLLDGSPETLYNADIAMPFVQVYLAARVAEVPIV